MAKNSRYDFEYPVKNSIFFEKNLQNSSESSRNFQWFFGFSQKLKPFFVEFSFGKWIFQKKRVKEFPKNSMNFPKNWRMNFPKNSRIWKKTQSFGGNVPQVASQKLGKKIADLKPGFFRHIKQNSRTKKLNSRKNSITQGKNSSFRQCSHKFDIFQLETSWIYLKTIFNVFIGN